VSLSSADFSEMSVNPLRESTSRELVLQIPEVNCCFGLSVHTHFYILKGPALDTML
jgi:hypothetical protein